MFCPVGNAKQIKDPHPVDTGVCAEQLHSWDENHHFQWLCENQRDVSLLVPSLCMECTFTCCTVVQVLEKQMDSHCGTLCVSAKCLCQAFNIFFKVIPEEFCHILWLLCHQTQNCLEDRVAS